MSVIIAMTLPTRDEAVAYIMAHGLQDLLVSMNDSLGEYKRPTAVEFADEIILAAVAQHVRVWVVVIPFTPPTAPTEPSPPPRLSASRCSPIHPPAEWS